MPDLHPEKPAAVPTEVGTFVLKLRKGYDGMPRWSVDDGPEASTAEAVLAAAGRQMDFATAQIPGYGWKDR